MFSGFCRSPSPVDAIVGLAYLAAAAATVSLTRFDGGVAFIWIANGILLARLTALAPRRWGGPLATCAVACIITTTFFGFGFAAVIPMMVINLGESVLAAALLRRTIPDRNYFDTVDGVAWFMAIAGGIAPFLSGLGAAWVTAWVTGSAYAPNLLHWVTAHGLGVLITMPIILSTSANLGRRPSLLRAVEVGAVLASVAAVTGLVFAQNSLPILFIPMLPMMLAALRCGRIGTGAALLIVAIVGGYLTALGHGPVYLMRTDAGTRSLFFQGYLACCALLVLPVSALLKQRAALIGRLSENEARFRVIAERVGDAIVDVAVDGTIRYASPAIAELTGKSPDALFGTSACDLVLEDDLGPIWELHKSAVAAPDRSHSGEYRGVTVFDDVRWFEVVMRAIVTPEGRSIGVIGAIRDVSERKRSERDLLKQAGTDPLTGLSNRRAFLVAIEARLARISDDGGEASLVLFDLDHFKVVNDTYGHAAGDAVLKHVASALTPILRDGDAIGRIGGEEFGVLLSGASPSDARAATLRLLGGIRSMSVPVGAGKCLSVTASFGMVALKPEMSVELAMNEALYESKRAGRDRVSLAA
jgi:diguanylate cyclase (GGDEF)-like protein/PAS domain S-box-containing protein